MINLHIVRNSVTMDSRVLKETNSLAKSGLFKKVLVCGFAEPNDLYEEVINDCFVKRISLNTRSLPKDLVSQSIKYVEWHWKAIREYHKEQIRVIHCDDLEPLPIAVHLKRLTGAKLVYDAHELETECNGLYGLRKMLATWEEKLLLKYVDAIITVSPSILDWYASRFPRCPISLVRNIPILPESSVLPINLRDQLNIPERALLFLYLGGLGPGRGIEIALNAFRDPRVIHHIVFMGNGPLHSHIADAMKSCKRIHLLEPVPPTEVLRYAQGADIGVCLYEDTCLNHRYCLPNKLFESLLSGIPVLASDLPDQACLVKAYDAGWVVQNKPEMISHFLSELSFEEAKRMRKGLRDRVASLSWAKESSKLISLYKRLLKT